MRRDYFTSTVDDATGEGARQPVLTIEYDGPDGRLAERMQAGGTLRDDGDVDVAYRLKPEDGEASGDGVLALADRVTGEYVLELNVPTADVYALVDAAREYGQSAETEDRYRIVLHADGDHLVTYEKSTLLVYDDAGELLRSRSLIPSGVEL